MDDKKKMEMMDIKFKLRGVALQSSSRGKMNDKLDRHKRKWFLYKIKRGWPNPKLK
jgi:hypothetical protein